MEILTVDDDNFHLEALERALTQLGHTAIFAASAQDALNILRKGEIHLVITDWEMPGMNGLDLCRAIRREEFNGYIYLIMLTGREGALPRREGLKAGADAFVNKPLEMDELEVSLKTAERILALETRDVALFALAKLAESRDPEVGGHIERVQSYTRLLAQHLSPQIKKFHGVDGDYIRLLYQTSPLHDLGKVGIPDSVLLKPGKLTPEEFEIMKTHTTMGAQTLDAALQRFPNVRFLQIARDIAISHHEKFNGSGYPMGLAGEQIPFCGRIVAAADVYDALTSRRVYKDAMPHQKAFETICKDRGTHFDPDVIDALIAAEKEIVAVQERLKDDSPPQEEKKVLPEEENHPAPSQRPCGILAVEDSPMILKMVTSLLGETGEPIYSASNSDQALSIFAREHPSLIVSDLEMPGENGLELCRRIRALPVAYPVHFIMLTQYSDQTAVLEAYKAGVDDFLSKPFNSDELKARVRAGLRNCRMHDELSRKSTHLQEANVRLIQMNGRLDKLSITDELTGLFNRRHAMVRLEEQWALAERYDRLLTVAMVDIDRFKNVNDSFGHDAGDAVLRRVAAILRDQTRGTDAVCRIGGEEFLIIFPSETVREAVACCQRCRKALEAETIRVGDAQINATISVGVAARNATTPQFTALLREADKALYAAKNAGRNRVLTADELTKGSENSMPVAAPTPIAEATPVTAPVPPPTPALTINCPVHWDQVITRCGGDVTFASAIARRFLAQAPIELTRIKDSLAQRDADVLRRTAHSLKSMSAYVSADTASTLCREIEDLARNARIDEIPGLLLKLQNQVQHVLDWITTNVPAEKALCA